MSTGIFSIGNSALNAAYTALRTTGNNIANANTQGYTRQNVVLTPQASSVSGSAFVGQGVALTDVRREYNDFLTQAAHLARAGSSAAETRSLQLAQVTNLFGDSTTGIGSALDGFFRQVQDLTQRPSDPGVRQALLSSANLLSARMTDTGARLQEFRENTDTQIRLELQKVNRLAAEVADLNDKIALAQGAGRAPNDLLDRRDTAVRQLNESIRVNGVTQSDGSMNLFLGNGQPLVVGSSASTMAMQISNVDPQQVQIGVKQGSAFVAIDSSVVGGGRIGGLMQFRTEDLPQAENDLGRLAITLTETFNTQHKLGNDLTGAAGQNFFKPITPFAFGASTNAAAGSTVTATITDATQLQASDYRIDVAGGQYTLTRQSDGRTWTSATPTFNQDGLNIALGGTAASNGDIFLIQAVRGGTRGFGVSVTQPNQIAAANPVQANIPLANTGSVVVEDLSVVGPTRNPALSTAVAITFTNATTYTTTIGAVTSGPLTYTPGTPISVNGWSLTLRGTPNANDVVNVTANVGGVGDNRNALKLSLLQDTPLVDGGRLAGGYASVVARIGGDAQSASLYSSAQGTILEDAINAEASVAGVNLDEEASRLIQYQQQYQAAAKVIATAKIIFDEILNIGR